jgi:hypothetical protein
MGAVCSYLGDDVMKTGKGKVFALYAQAKKKGLTIQKNVFSVGYCVLLPNGQACPMTSIQDLRSFVKDY